MADHVEKCPTYRIMFQGNRATVQVREDGTWIKRKDHEREIAKLKEENKASKVLSVKIIQENSSLRTELAKGE